MQKSKSDHSVFYKNSSFGIILLVVHMDDIVVTGSDSKDIISLKFFFFIVTFTQNLGMLKYLLGVEVIRSREFGYLTENMYLTCYLRQGNWAQTM